jgi:predicted amidohydrolase YtcJ
MTVRTMGLAALLAGGLIACGAESPADLVVFGAAWTGDNAQPWVEAVAVRGETIVAVGDSADMARLVGPATTVLYSEGTVTPGLMDNHTHFMAGGFQLASVDLRDAATPAEFARRIGEFAARSQPGEWILGGDWDHELWPDAELPRRDWIDSLTPDNPVFVTRLDGHMGLANSLALASAGMDDAIPDREGGVIIRYPGSRRPTGLLKDNAMNPVYAILPDPSPSQRDSALARGMQHAAEMGVTAVAEVSGSWANLAAVQRARAAGTLTLRVALYHSLWDWRAWADTIEHYGMGDDWVRLQGLKGFVDGSLGSTTAAFDEPYSDDPSTAGTLVNSEADLRSLLGAADSAGLQLAIHAIGDRANALLLDIYDSLENVHGPRDRRWRVEHAQHLRPGDFGRFARLGVIASMQPFHAIDDGRWAGKRIGPERIKTTYAFRSFLDAGAVLSFGSDWTVGPLDPLIGMYAAVTRRTIDGAHPGGWVPEEKITIEESLRAYTWANAHGFFLEDRLGRLMPGYAADLVLLDGDLMASPPDQLDEIRVASTVVGGRVVYQRTREAP